MIYFLQYYTWGYTSELAHHIDKSKLFVKQENYDQDNATDACDRPLDTKIKRIKSNTSEIQSTNISFH